jgi:protection of telomeres protein 1
MHENVSRFYHAVQKDRLPDVRTFQEITLQSVRVKDKAALLKDVKDGAFYDLVVQASKDPYDEGDKIGLWITDFTENPGFYNYVFGISGRSNGPDHDPYGYTTKYGPSKSDWQGPFGRRSLQVTIYEPHASIVREKVQRGTWMMLRNVQVKYGANGSNLEGYLREDRTYGGGKKLNVDVLDPFSGTSEESKAVGPRLKEAISLKRDYERSFKTQLRRLKSEDKENEHSTDRKRKLTESDSAPAKKRRNGRQRKALQRAKMQQNEQETEKKTAEMLGLNEQGTAHVIWSSPGMRLTRYS